MIKKLYFQPFPMQEPLGVPGTSTCNVDTFLLKFNN